MSGGKIKDAAVTGAKIAADAITSDKVLDDTQPGGGLTSADLAPDSVTATVTTQNGLKIVEVTITAPLPVLGLLGPSGSMVVTGRSIMERQ